MDRIATLANIKEAEGFRAKPYKDTMGLLTIGYGRCLDRVGISQAEAEIMLTNDFDAVCRALDHELPGWRSWPMPAGNAIAEMAFNLGIAGLLKFENMLAACRAGDWKRAAAEALDSAWAKQVGTRALRIAGQFRSAAE